MNLPIPTGLKLYPYQERGVRHLLEFIQKSGSTYLADEQGLGKTVQIAVLLNIVLKQLTAYNVLIVVPASLRLNWLKELRKWLLIDIDLIPILTTKDIENIIPEKNQCIIVSYDLAHRLKVAEAILSKKYAVFVMDEAHYVKNPDTARARFCLNKVWPLSDVKIASTGTPIPNNPTEAYSLFSKMMPGQWKSYWGFAYRYAQIIDTHFGKKVVGGRNLKELGTLARQNFMVRRTKKQVLPELPPKIYQTLPIETQAEDTHLVGKMVGDAIRTGEHMKEINEDKPLAVMRRELGEAKVKPAVSIILDELENPEPLVAFGYHRNVISATMHELSERGISCASITGETPPTERQRIVDDFQAGKIRVLVGNIVAAGTGITLTAASTCIFLEYDFTPANMMQAIDRLHRISQKNVVRVIYLQAVNTMDEDIIRALSSKLRTINEVLK